MGLSAPEISSRLGRSKHPIYNVIHFLEEGNTIQDYYRRYKENKKNCGANNKELPENQVAYIKEKVADNWTPDVIIGRSDNKIGCSTRTLYRRFKDSNMFDVTTLPMKGKRKPNGHKEKRGKQAFRRQLKDGKKKYPDFVNEFGHLEGDTIVGLNHKSAVITLVECLSKVIITLNPDGRKAKDIETSLDFWFQNLQLNLFKSITFDCGKEFSNLKIISIHHDVSILFADPGCPSQRGLNEHSNGLLRRDGLYKQMDFNTINQAFVSSVAIKRNKIPRKSLNYRTPIEVFLEHVPDWKSSSLI
ncbi:IS30 family transposase [Alkalibacterium sp. 20]|uniref:IS30 family transposase n=1 Tax=Alkalibacterium sp. 20 TaxID=1798803 RepID=UPI00210E61F8|nr:IS30 family transposase [Alkalibacterium sp. 20]